MLGPVLIVVCNMLKNIELWTENGAGIWTMTESSTDSLFGEDLEAIFSLIESDSFDESPEGTSVVTLS